ncbi:MAG: hypothetical protein V4543_12325 [Bacteroidota bacterium]
MNTTAKGAGSTQRNLPETPEITDTAFAYMIGGPAEISLPRASEYMITAAQKKVAQILTFESNPLEIFNALDDAQSHIVEEMCTGLCGNEETASRYHVLRLLRNSLGLDIILQMVDRNPAPALNKD